MQKRREIPRLMRIASKSERRRKESDNRINRLNERGKKEKRQVRKHVEIVKNRRMKKRSREAENKRKGIKE